MTTTSSRLWMVWLAAAMVSVAAYTWANMDLLGDTFWYIATGRYVLAHHAFPLDELFSYTGVRGPWVVNMPISEPMFAWITDHWGVWALLGISTAVFSASLFLLWLPHARGVTAKILVWPLVILAIYVESVDLSARGQTFADLFIAILFICMFRLRDGKRVPLWIPVLLGALWVNVHPSFLLGVLVPLGFAIALRIAPKEHRPKLAPLLTFTVLEALGGLINPYGYKLIAEFLRFTTAESTTAIDLFQSPTFTLPGIVASLVVGAALIFACLRSSSEKAGIADAILLLVLVTATCVSRRYVTMLVFAEIVIAGRYLATAPRLVSQPVRPWLLGFAALPAILLTGFALTEPKDPWLNMPVAAADYIEQHDLPDNVLNMLHWGGYLDYKWGGRRKVFIDGRTTQFENGVLTDESKLVAVTPDSRELLDVYLINTVLWERGSPLDQALSQDPDWTAVYREGIAVVYVRKKPKT